MLFVEINLLVQGNMDLSDYNFQENMMQAQDNESKQPDTFSNIQNLGSLSEGFYFIRIIIDNHIQRKVIIEINDYRK